MPVVDDYTALLSGSYWGGIEVTGKPTIVTYSFATAAPAYLSEVAEFTPDIIASFEAFNTAEKAQARAALAEWSAASGLVFLEVAGVGDLNFQLVNLDPNPGNGTPEGPGGIAFYPFGDWDFFTYPNFSSGVDSSGDVFMNSALVSGGLVDYGTLLHEIGHAIGLKHPTEIVTNFAPFPPVVHDQVLSFNDPSRTIMAEGPGPGALQQLDRDAAAFIYGAAGTGGVHTANASGANSAVSSWSWNLATLTLTQSGFAGNDDIRGSSVKDVINGLDGDDNLFGLAGNDTLYGGLGNDLLHGGAGANSLTGGDDNDTYFVNSSSDKVFELADEGDDYVISTINYTLTANVETLQLFGDNLSGRGNGLDNTIYGDGLLRNRLYGLGGFDYLTGGSQNDILDGGTEADGLAGFGGNDMYYVDDLNDVIFEDAGGGSDTAFASATYVLGANVEKLTLTGSADIDGTGNAIANTITGNEFANTLTGGGSADTLYGRGGNDTLSGGTGVDVMDGGEGSDTYLTPDATDVISDTGAVGGDKVVSKGNFTLAAGNGVENLQVNAGVQSATLTGNELANRIQGNNGVNFILGLDGNDVLTANGGDDRLTGGLGRDTMTGGANTDRFIFNSGDTGATASTFDTVTDFLGGTDKIDLDVIGAGGLPLAQYEEVAVASNNFNTILSAVNAAFADGQQQAVFVAAASDGYLFWSTDGLNTTAEASVKLTGLNSVGLFGHGDLM